MQHQLGKWGNKYRMSAINTVIRGSLFNLQSTFLLFLLHQTKEVLYRRNNL